MSWLRKARKFKGISANELAKSVGVSLNYIQRIEGGSRAFESEIRNRIFDALGFNQEDISFETPTLLSRLNELSESYGDNAFCGLEYVKVEGRLYCTDVIDLKEGSFNPSLSEGSSNPIRIKYARDVLWAQVVLFEK